LNPPDALVPALLAAMLILALWRCREAARS
jgi:hypothetical protein